MSGVQTDVLVVGAGPTGLMLGTELGLAGVSPMIIDTLLTPSGQARGAGVQPRTVEVFDLRGMVDQLTTASRSTLVGVPFPGQAGTRPAVLAEVRLTSISDLVPRRISHFAAMVRDGGGYWSMLSPLEGICTGWRSAP